MAEVHEKALRARFLVVGGFLGAGKTTALLRLAQTYHDEGKRVGLITNDQAANLVDTGNLRLRGFRVEEVAGACFCCKFEELARAAERLGAEEKPEILLGEPVGSCTDLAATVVAPFRKLYGDRYAVAPYSVLLDPVRARQIVLEKGFGGFSSKVAYIFQKQLEEAEIICLNKADLLTPVERGRMVEGLTREFPQARLILTSGLTGEGFDDWRSLLDEELSGGHIADVDYDTYAEGEAELGWLNLTFEVASPQAFHADLMVKDLVDEMRSHLSARRAEVAHIKAMFEAGGGAARKAAVANYVGGGSTVNLSQPSEALASRGQLFLNARVHVDPEVLRTVADEALARVLPLHKATGRLGESTHFRPGRPVPTHRFTAP